MWIIAGFRDAHAKSAATILAAVKKVMSERGTTKVTLVGHSLGSCSLTLGCKYMCSFQRHSEPGGALSFLEAVYLRSNLATSTTFKIVTLGCPRVGNQAWADYIDAKVSLACRFTHPEYPSHLYPSVLGRDTPQQLGGSYSYCTGPFLGLSPSQRRGNADIY